MIGVFDSGVGGLGVLAEIRRLMPDVDLVYVADQGRAPYGPKSLDEVAGISEEIAGWLIARGSETVVVACNTASAAALEHLRRSHPRTRFVGMEPAVKPAASATATGIIGVVATAATFQGELYASVVARHAPEVKVLTAACPEWVALVEAGATTGARTRQAVEACLRPMLESGIDALVLGCTHFPFLRALIEEVAGPGVVVLDPAPAVALQTSRVHRGSPGGGLLRLYTSSDPRRFEVLARGLAGIQPTEPALAWSPE